MGAFALLFLVCTVWLASKPTMSMHLVIAGERYGVTQIRKGAVPYGEEFLDLSESAQKQVYDFQWWDDVGEDGMWAASAKPSGAKRGVTSLMFAGDTYDLPFYIELIPGSVCSAFLLGLAILLRRRTQAQQGEEPNAG